MRGCFKRVSPSFPSAHRGELTHPVAWPGSVGGEAEAKLECCERLASDRRLSLRRI